MAVKKKRKRFAVVPAPPLAPVPREKIDAVSRRLATATEALNASLDEAEVALTALKLGVRAEVPLDDRGNVLGFGKFDNRWRLLWLSRLSTTETEGPMRNASRELRLQAVEHLEALFHALLDAAEREVERVSRGTALVNDFADTLRSTREEEITRAVIAVELSKLEDT